MGRLDQLQAVCGSVLSGTRVLAARDTVVGALKVDVGNGVEVAAVADEPVHGAAAGLVINETWLVTRGFADCVSFACSCGLSINIVVA